MNRRRLLAAVLPLLAAAGWRSARGQVGSGGSGITGDVGRVALLAGSATVQRQGRPAIALAQGATLMQGDRIETAAASEVHIEFDDGGYLALREQSAIELEQYVAAGEATDIATIRLLRGALRSVTGWIGKLDPSRYTIAAGDATIGVLGTDHEVALVAAGDATPGVQAGVHDRVNEGATTLRNPAGVLQIAKGSAAYSPGSGQPPLLHRGVPAFFDRLRTGRDAAIEMHARTIRRRMEERLRARGKLRPDEHFDGFRRRVGRLRPLRAGLNPAAPAGPGNAAPANAQQSAREAMQAQRRERALLRQQRMAERRQQQKAVRAPRRLPE